jgi:dipeptidyl aminopeptidase/acylaminoacyl peptidase
MISTAVAEANQSPAGGRIRRQLFVGHWNELQDGRRSQLFSIALDKRGIAAAEPVKLTIDIEGDVPGKPFGGREDYSISPDGTRVAFAERDSGAKEAWMPNADIYTAFASGGDRAPNGRPLKDADPVNVTLENIADDRQPAFSPDGTQLAYLAADRTDDPADRLHLVLLTLASGEKRPLTLNWDRSIQCFAWTPDGKSLIATTDHLGQRPLWRIDTRSGGATRITGDGRVEAFSVAGNRIYYAASTLGSPPDLYSIGIDGGKPLRLTRLNEPLLAQRTLGPYEAFAFPGWNGETVHGYLVKPADVAPQKKCPVALLLHDGPHASLANGWDWRWNAQVFAAAGFGVLMIDFHGSTGYGQAFADSVNGDLGGKPLDDLKAGIDFALRQYPWLDDVRLCSAGRRQVRQPGRLCEAKSDRSREGLETPPADHPRAARFSGSLFPGTGRVHRTAKNPASR